MPRATTAAWLVLPPRAVSIPSRGDHALQVVGVGLPADQDAPSRRVRAHSARSPSRTPPGRPPRPATPPCPWSAACASAALSNCGNISCASCAPDTRPSASSSVISCSSTSCAAIRNAAAGVRLPDPGLQHPQLAALDGELDVAQVPVVRLQPAHHPGQLPVRLRVQLRQVVQRQGVPDAGDHVLALRVGR